MKKITVNDKELELPESWFELTFNKFVKFTSLLGSQKTEKEIRAAYINEGFSEEITDLKIGVDNMTFNTKIASFWSGLSEDEIAMLPMEKVEDILKCCSFVNDPYTPMVLDKFKFKDETYYLPKANMKKENFGTFIEAEQIEINNKQMENGNLSVLPQQMAILCKKEGEESGLIDDSVVERRTELFKELDMATVWDVAFFLLRQESILLSSILTYTRTQATQKQELPQKGQ